MRLREKRRVPVLHPGRGPYNGLAHRMVQYLEWKQERNGTAQGQRQLEHRLSLFLLWCEERGLEQAGDISLRELEQYQRYLYQRPGRGGKPLSVTSQINYLTALRGLFGWLTRRHCIRANPAADLELPKAELKLPKDVLSHAEAEQILAWPDINTVRGLRDRAMLEVLYSTGMRRMELAGLKLHSINDNNGTVMICQGKGRKDRLIPIGERARQWVRRYVAEARPALTDFPPNDVLFLAKDGQGFSPEGLSDHIGRIIRESGIREKGSCHLFRHTMATQMLEHGAELRWIQAMLGHADISTTQVYTRVSIRALREIHRATHPAEQASVADEK
ncbi:site-specific tyrosine recombinase XerC [Tenebrionicola larvae]|uniref:Site-specific tyrosine recombinase XerC n=1 Tax=Tenebrionicola larvae TaxID=2815733 RepID=A0A949Q9G9_9ENTR|nr:site-specific tyrosine recombinase XerC [Tenebrionicola larvae]MBV5097558.1 site-specific tyrosine recombinase XerC [Tenebrionicola larvae]